jgi:hypothetical protein
MVAIKMLSVVLNSIASALSLSFGVAQLLNQQYVLGAALLGTGVYLFGWACATR